jgi:hypothetical protein
MTILLERDINAEADLNGLNMKRLTSRTGVVKPA